MSEGDSDVTQVTLSGPMTLYESSVARETLLNALEDGKPLRIDLGHTGPWDLAGLQLLVSAVNTGLRSGVSVRLESVPGVCREIAGRSGLSRWLTDVAGSYE